MEPAGRGTHVFPFNTDQGVGRRRLTGRAQPASQACWTSIRRCRRGSPPACAMPGATCQACRSGSCTWRSRSRRGARPSFTSTSAGRGRRIHHRPNPRVTRGHADRDQRISRQARLRADTRSDQYRKMRGSARQPESSDPDQPRRVHGWRGRDQRDRVPRHAHIDCGDEASTASSTIAALTARRSCGTERRSACLPDRAACDCSQATRSCLARRGCRGDISHGSTTMRIAKSNPSSQSHVPGKQRAPGDATVATRPAVASPDGSQRSARSTIRTSRRRRAARFDRAGRLSTMSAQSVQPRGHEVRAHAVSRCTATILWRVSLSQCVLVASVERKHEQRQPGHGRHVLLDCPRGRSSVRC